MHYLMTVLHPNAQAMSAVAGAEDTKPNEADQLLSKGDMPSASPGAGDRGEDN